MSERALSPREIVARALLFVAPGPDMTSYAMSKVRARQSAGSILAALADHGYVVIPVEPSDAMVETAAEAYCIKGCDDEDWCGSAVYLPSMRAALAAALSKEAA